MLRPFVFAVVALATFLPGSARASMIAVYSRPGESLSLDTAVALVHAARLDTSGLTHAGYRIIRVDSSVLSAEYSVDTGVSAYFWSDQTFSMAGFNMKGAHVTFEREIPVTVTIADGPAKTDAGDSTQALAVARVGHSVNRFEGASRESNGLVLSGFLSHPGRVSVEAYSANGRTIGRWDWMESSAGSFHRSVRWKQEPTGMVLLRLSAGGMQDVRPITGR